MKIDAMPILINAEDTLSVNVGNEFTMNTEDIFIDPDGDELTFSIIGSIPTWLSFNNKILSGIPTLEDVAEYNITIRANDGMVNNDYSFVLFVTNNTAPAIGYMPEDIVLEAESSTYFSIGGDLFQDPDNDSLLISAYLKEGNELPDFMILDKDEMKLHINPTSQDVGVYHIILKANDQRGGITAISLWVNIVKTISSVNMDDIKSIRVYPNPAIDFINIKVGMHLVGEKYMIYNESGQLLHSDSIKSDFTRIDVSGLGAKFLILKISNNFSTRIIKN